MDERYKQILETIQSSIEKNTENHSTQASYEYECRKCGLTLNFNWMGNHKCPLDGSTMYRTS